MLKKCEGLHLLANWSNMDFPDMLEHFDRFPLLQITKPHRRHVM